MGKVVRMTGGSAVLIELQQFRRSILGRDRSPNNSTVGQAVVKVASRHNQPPRNSSKSSRTRRFKIKT